MLVLSMFYLIFLRFGYFFWHPEKCLKDISNLRSDSRRSEKKLKEIKKQLNDKLR